MDTTTESTTITIRVDGELASWLESEARALGISQGKLVREQLQRARKAKKKACAFMRIAGSIDGSADLSQRKGFSRK